MDFHSSNWDHCLEIAAQSDMGMRRANNQDSLAVTLAPDQSMFESRGHMFLVADGMGAHAAGEMASKLAADNIPLGFHKCIDLNKPDALRRAVQDANDLIHRRGQSVDDFKGMGTTSSMLLLAPEGAMMCHVGDSRVYRLRGTTLEQLTFDHSLVWEMRAAGQLPADQIEAYIPKNIITRSLGPNPHVQADVEGPFPLEIGDTFLLCSDGLSGQLHDKEIGAILGCLPAKKAASTLIDLANLRGGPDNITVIIVRVVGPLQAKVSAATPGPATSGRRGPAVHPAVWMVLGISVLAGLIMALLQYWIAAGACLGVAGLSGLVALILGWVGPGGSNLSAGGRQGRAPYVRIDCTPDLEIVNWLSAVAAELRQAAAQHDWKIDWATFNGWRDRAAAHQQAGRLGHAVHDYAEGISSLTGALRSQGRRPADNESVL